jgi:hypothetical protein
MDFPSFDEQRIDFFVCFGTAPARAAGGGQRDANRDHWQKKTRVLEYDADMVEVHFKLVQVWPESSGMPVEDQEQ